MVAAATARCDLAQPLADKSSRPRRRGATMKRGPRWVVATRCVFLHADTTLPRRRRPSDCRGTRAARLGPFRSVHRRTASVPGGRCPHDQLALAVDRDRRRRPGDLCHSRGFVAVGGFPDLPLMEDIAIRGGSNAYAGRFASARRSSPPAGAGTTRRRAHHRSDVALRLAYYFGVEPARLARRYVRSRRPPRKVAPGHNLAPRAHIAADASRRRERLRGVPSPMRMSRRRAPARPYRPCPRRRCLGLLGVAIMPTARTAKPASRRIRSATGTLIAGIVGGRLSGVMSPRRHRRNRARPL